MRHEKLLSCVVDQRNLRDKRHPKHKDYCHCHCHCYFQEFEGKALLQKTAHPSSGELGGIKLEMNIEATSLRRDSPSVGRCASC